MTWRVALSAPDKACFQIKRTDLFLFSKKTYVVGTHQKCLAKMLLMSTHNMFSWRNKENIVWIPTLIWNYGCTCNHHRKAVKCVLRAITASTSYFYLTLSILDKISSRWHTEIFYLFFLENRIWQFMQIVSTGDNLHEMSNPVLIFSPKNRIWKFMQTLSNLNEMSNPVFPISCKLSPMETICMKCQIQFSWKNMKKFSKSHLLQFLPSKQSIKKQTDLCLHCLFKSNCPSI